MALAEPDGAWKYETIFCVCGEFVRFPYWTDRELVDAIEMKQWIVCSTCLHRVGLDTPRSA